LAASPAYLALHGEPKTPADIEAHDTIFGSLWTRPTEWRFGTADKPIFARLTPRLFVNDNEAVLTAARAGRGIARPLSYQVADDLASGALKRLLVEFEPDPLPVQLVTASAANRSSTLNTFLDHASEVLRALPVLRE
jgi:DNA-binding transcriptional LysR family regulator